MEQPGGRTPDSKLSGRYYWPVVIGGLVATSVIVAGLYSSYQALPKGPDHDVEGIIGVAVAALIVIWSGFSSWRSHARAKVDEAQARQRVRQAEDNLADSLRVPLSVAHEYALRKQLGIYADNNQGGERKVQVPGPERVDLGTLDTAEAVEQVAKERRDDRLTLAALWDVTHGRMDLYHRIVTGQAKRSFIAAQVAMGIGFVLLVVFAFLAADAKTTAAAIGAGGLGAVGAAFAAYIGKTFIRSQESAASHLRAYFDQPLELSRYLAAERLLSDAKDLTPEQHAAIISSLVQSIATAGQQDGKPEADRPRKPAPGAS